MDEDNQSAVSKFLEGVEDNKFEPVVDSPFSEPEVEPVVEKEEKPLPYHKDEKLQKYISKEVEKRLKDFTPETKEVEKKEDDDYWVRLIGNDTPEKVAMTKEAKLREERLLEQAEERAFNRLSAHEQEQVREEQEAVEELGNALESIEENFDVDLSNQKLRSDFLTYVERIAPKDRDGEIIEYPDMNSAWETFSERRTSQPSRAKQLASQGLSRSSSETTSVQPKRLNWDAADEYIESLK